MDNKQPIMARSKNVFMADGKPHNAPISDENKKVFSGMETIMLKKVLAVDDSELIHNMYKLILRKYKGLTLLKALNGKEGVEILIKENDVELILLDINMPVMNGIQFLEAIKKEGIHDHIPIIIISTEGKEEDTLRGLSLGAKGYIVKPFKSITLHEMISNILKDNKAVAR